MPLDKTLLEYIIDDVRTINALRARSRLGTLLDEVSQEGTHYIIERLHKPLVAVVPFDEYQKYHQEIRRRGSQTAELELLKAILQFRQNYGDELAKAPSATSLLKKQRTKRTRNLMKLTDLSP